MEKNTEARESYEKHRKKLSGFALTPWEDLKDSSKRAWIMSTRPATCRNCLSWGQYPEKAQGYCMTLNAEKDDTVDGVYVKAAMVTGEDFGCIHFEDKDL